MQVDVISTDAGRCGSIVAFLQERGLVVSAAAGVAELPSASGPTLVIYDLSEQEVWQGTELRAALRTHFGRQPHLVLALVDPAQRDVLADLIEAGFDDVGLRPLELERLIGRVELSRRRLVQAITEVPVVELSRLLRAAADASHALLVEDDFPSAVYRALSALGHATSVDAISVVEYHPHPGSGRQSASTRYRWRRSTEQLELRPAEDQNLPAHLPVNTRWIEEFRAGRFIGGPVSQFEQAERARYESMGIQSMLTMPLMPHERLLGFVLLVDGASPRIWNHDEETILRAVAGSLGGALLRHTAADELERQEARFRSLIQNLPDTLAVIDPDGTILYHSPSSERTIGVPAVERIGANAFEFVYPDDAPTLRACIDELVEEPGATARCEVRVLRKGDVWRRVAVLATNLRHDPAIGGIVINSRDITEQRAAEEALRKSEERFRSMVQNGSEMITIISADGGCVYQSPSVERVLGYPWRQFIGRSALDYVHPGDRERVRRAFRELAKERAPRAVRMLELRAQHSDGGWVFLEALATNLLGDPAVRGIVLNSRDITERKRLEDQLSWQAFHDMLTSLPNRALFRDRLEHAVARANRQGSSIAVLFLDLDRFKIVNDSLGHDVGDQLLVAVGERLLETVRESDTLARLGGDEFTVLVEDVLDTRELTLLAERLIERLREPFPLDVGHEVFVAVSIGIAVGIAGRQGADELLRNADVALYRAKGQNQNGYEFFRPGMLDHPRSRLALETDLQRAIERAELRIHFQPEIDLHTGELRALEALVRWQHATRGMILPAEFIEVAEETGLIVPIGRWVLEEACRQAMTWPEPLSGARPTLSVNLSARELQQPDLIEHVEYVLRRVGFDPHGLRIEITESVLVQEAQTTLGTLRALKELGIQIAIDDFGIGYSSLSYLTRLPVDTLKIDRLFVSGQGREIGNLAIIRAVASLAHALEMTVTAEGVETIEQLRRVVEAGCQRGQGHYFSRAVPAERVVELLALGAFRVGIQALSAGVSNVDSVAL